MENVPYIITAKHYALREGCAGVRDRIIKLAADAGRKRKAIIRVQIDKSSTRPVFARIELGQWLADCECGGCEFVDPIEPVFFCLSCGNRNDANMLRPVTFPLPEERAEIETLILARPVNDLRGLDDCERAHQALPLIVSETPDGMIVPLTRTWNHGEPIENLRRENEVIDIWKRKKEA